ncbi:winged helix DNA-binding protein [Maribellus sp. YY47]|uniref:MarR family winged helix-turn-helix transcriptional regulator n=1 Tax=Maribellus sp. YY47 TaxID=2929486 RepID=UPI0020007732|nr:winged helix DNA-binding protein [Maribellus sp. YY47]MCK3685106.1 winged helix DNA-binding protein [Maribellus sp. YY47]
MPINYSLLRQIIDLAEEFEQKSQATDILDFAHWIIEKHSIDSETSEPFSLTKKNITTVEDHQIFENRRPETRFLEYVARIARYHEFYVRKALQEYDINTRVEFLLLQTVEKSELVKKTDLINIHLLEYTTGMDTIHRLIKKELIKEVQSTTDKRVKLLTITTRGKEVIDQTSKRILEENEMFFLAINNRWKKMPPLLEEIDRFHNNIYQKHNSKPFAEINNLMDSLKYLSQ